MSANMSKEKLPPYINFLDSDAISLQASQSERTFKIHRKLLESKCKTVALAFTRGFEEEQKGLYAFEDTSEGTLARFIEWAYTRDYPAVINATESVQASTKETEKAETVVEEKNTVTTAGTDFISESHPLLAHAHLYVFCNIYSIPDLQDVASMRMMAWIVYLKKPNDRHTRLVISALRVLFGNLPKHDPFLDWLAQYAAYALDKLRTHGSFLDLLESSPILASRMVPFLNPGSSPPWKIESSKYNYPY